jgi:hypothetical protein
VWTKISSSVGFPQVVEKTVDNSQGDVNIFFSLSPGRRKGLGRREIFSTAANFVFFLPLVGKQIFSHPGVWKNVFSRRIFLPFSTPCGKRFALITKYLYFCSIDAFFFGGRRPKEKSFAKKKGRYVGPAPHPATFFEKKVDQKTYFYPNLRSKNRAPIGQWPDWAWLFEKVLGRGYGGNPFSKGVSAHIPLFYLILS